MNSEIVAIGQAAYGRKGFGAGWMDIEANKDNIYRVLPPMKSLAQKRTYAKFYRTHRGFRGTDGKQKPFRCIEESDFKTRVITTHCPVCDKVYELEKMYEQYKAQGASKDQLKKFREEYIFPMQAENKYYLNVVNPENKIGILPIGSKMFKALDGLCKKYEAKGFDLCGMEGYYLNFQKTSAFKGDKDAVFGVDVYMHPYPDGSYRPVTHQIDEAFAKRLGPEAADLGAMFKVLTVEQIAQIVALEGPSQAKFIDGLFESDSASKKPAPVEASAAPVASGFPAPVVSAASTPSPAGFTPPVQAPPLVPAAPVLQPSNPFPAAQPLQQMPPVSSFPGTAPVPQPGPAFEGSAGAGSGFGISNGSGFGGALAQAQGPTSPPPGFTPPVGFNPGGFPAKAATSFTPHVGAAPVGAGAPVSQLNDAEFAAMVRPKKG